MVGSLVGRCVELLVERQGATGYGSGLRLATSLVVTAGHVVEGGTAVRVRLFGGGPEEITVAGRTVWKGVRADIALVELAPDVRLGELAPVAVGVVPEDSDGRLPFTAVGFPRHRTWRDGDRATWRDSDQIDGIIPLGSSVKRGRLVLHRADGRLLEARDWSGFSGAAVVCQGAAVGVVVESAHSGGLEAVRLAAAIGTYEPRAESEREPDPSTAAARALLAGHGVVPERISVPGPPEERRRPAYEALLRQYAARCPELTGREQELAELTAFATGREPYLLLVAGPWAGKTSLVTHFATGAHPGMDMVSFVISRRDGQMRVQQFHRAVCEQLAALLGEFPPADPDAAVFLSLWERAVRDHERRGRPLVLMVDGLDENDFRELAEPSIAAQLPTGLGTTAHVLVTSRHPHVPLDVDGSHPLRGCRRRVLAPFPLATSLLLRARQELDHVLTEPLPRRVLTAMAVAGGALSSRDIASLTHDAPLAIRRTLERDLSRVVEPRPGRTTRYTLAHDTLVATVREDLDQEEVEHTRAAIDAWALGFAEAGWPDETPDYLTDAYPTLLLAEGAGHTLARLASSERRALLRRRAGGDLAALSEVSHASRLLAADPGCDLTMLARVALLRMRIEDDIRRVPSSYPLLLVRLGRTEEGVQLARTLQNTYSRADALLAVGEFLFGSRPVEARSLVLEAMAVPGRLELERVEHAMRAALALARRGEPDAAGIARQIVTDHLHGLYGHQRAWSIVTVAGPLAEIDPALTRDLIEEAVVHADDENRPDICGYLAQACGSLGEIDRLLRHLSALDRNDRRIALLRACEDHFAKGGRRNVPEMLLAALNREFPAAELVESAAYQDEERARHLLDLLPSAAAVLQFHDPGRLVHTTLAAHGHDPRQGAATTPGERDDLLAHAAASARNNGHLLLATSLGRDIADPVIRAESLSETALAILDTGTPQDADPVVGEIGAALEESVSAASPAVLAAFARAAGGAGRTELAEVAMDLALRTVLSDVNDHKATWAATPVATAAASLGRLEHTLAIAAAFQAEETDRIDILLDTAEALGDRPSADLDLLIDLVREGVENVDEPGTSGWRSRVLGDLVELLLRTGRIDEAMDLAANAGDPRALVLRMRAHLLSDDIAGAISLMRESDAGSPVDVARRQEQVAAMVVELCDSGHQALCRDFTAELTRIADLTLTFDDGLWARPWLAAACRATGLAEEYRTLLDLAQHAVLVTGSVATTVTVPVEAVVRLRLWDRYRVEAGRLAEVPAESVLTGLVEAMLEAGLLSETVAVIDDLDEDAAYCLALAAATGDRPSSDLVRRSLARGFVSEVITPLAALEPRCLDEIAAQLGVSS
ncbi:trypsin-like peptidase domain-containing protein [Nonomuraea sp. NPDC049709]|uniref:trypsin-like peptidase domain-containing protein n=1 Tax=Nonomuraea sp. NPDC049709 TaxID=3154736 RepID=UPI0034387619